MLSVQVLALAIALSSSGDTVLLDFHASWCAPCRSMASTIHELEGAGYPVREVNIDEGRALAAQYHVESIPCYVLLVDGQEVGRLNGAVRRSELLNLYAKAGVTPKKKGTVARGQSPDQGPAVIPVSRSAVMPAATVAAPPLAALPAPPGFAPSRSSQDLIRASVRLTVADPKGFSHGSGTIIDARGGEALVLTCGHLFRDAESKGQITVDCFGEGAPQKLPGKLIAYDLTTDLGLVSFRPTAAVQVARVAPKEFRVAKGDRVTTVGCNHGKDATAIESQITGVNKFLGPANFQVAGQPVEGRSGGGLFTSEGFVIGVCNAADPTDNEGLYAALPAIHGHLDKSGLAAVYQSPSTGDTMLAATSGAEAKLASLSDSERAALAQMQKHGDSAEVICIVRSLANPSAKSEVITLDRASTAFLKQLAADRQAQEGRHLTSLEVRPQQDSSARLLPRDRGR